MARILVAEDDPLYRELVETMLVRDGHAVVAVANGRQCLAALAAEAFDAVVADLFLPNSGGVESLAAIRATGVAVPVVGMIGGRNGMAGAEAGALIDLAADWVLAKPFTDGELRTAIASVLRKQA